MNASFEIGKASRSRASDSPRRASAWVSRMPANAETGTARPDRSEAGIA
jgi:hypothetical protein